MNMNLFKTLGATVLMGALLFSSVPTASAKTSSKAKGFPTSVTAKELTDAYASAKAGGDPVRILIVPGHEPNYGGAVFKGVYEREIVVEIAQSLAQDLAANKNVEVIIARDNLGWHKDLAKYFDKNMSKIERFVKKQKSDMKKLVKKGSVKELEEGHQVEHAAAPTDVALRLYGINKWANENDIDLVLNLHVNDAPDHGPNEPGANSGYAIYIPDAQYGNGAASRPVAQAIAERLNDMSATSTLRIENKGVAEDQTLIAVGAYNTLNVPTVLIEYGYITESKFLAPELRSTLTRDFAHQTNLGLRDLFGESTSGQYPTKTLPRTWNASPTVGSTTPETYALQAGLRILGFYPPSESTLVECPISGVMNECTEVAIKAYQKSLGLEETGTLGPQTRKALNARFSR